ncbi:TPA: hypothetical protein ACGO91_001504, partial [Streptococcus suis]
MPDHFTPSPWQMKNGYQNKKTGLPKSRKAYCLLFLAQLSLLFQGELLKRFEPCLSFNSKRQEKMVHRTISDC